MRRTPYFQDGCSFQRYSKDPVFKAPPEGYEKGRGRRAKSRAFCPFPKRPGGSGDTSGRGEKSDEAGIRAVGGTAREAGRIHNEKESKKMAPGRPEAGIRAVGGKKRRSGDTSGRRDGPRGRTNT